jgi:hypothetical protein
LISARLLLFLNRKTEKPKAAFSFIPLEKHLMPDSSTSTSGAQLRGGASRKVAGSFGALGTSDKKKKRKDTPRQLQSRKPMMM